MGTRLAAAESLGKLGPKAAKAAPALAKAMADKETPVADAAARALVKTGKPALPLIRAGLKEGETVRATMIAIAALGPNGAELTPDVVGAFKQFDGTAGLLEAAQSAVKAIGAPAVSALAEATKVRAISARAAELLRELGEAAAPAVPDLMALLTNKGELAYARAAAASAVGAVGKAARKHAPKLLEFAMDEREDGSVREAALRAIGDTGADDPRVAQEIEKLLADKDARRAGFAKSVLEQLKKQKP
jgi:HEAT repeat protein